MITFAQKLSNPTYLDQVLLRSVTLYCSDLLFIVSSLHSGPRNRRSVLPGRPRRAGLISFSDASVWSYCKYDIWELHYGISYSGP